MNSQKLKSLLVELDISQKELADYIGTSRSTFNLKLNGKTQFSIEEAKRIKKYLNLTSEQVDIIFFD